MHIVRMGLHLSRRAGCHLVRHLSWLKQMAQADAATLTKHYDMEVLEYAYAAAPYAAGAADSV